MIVPLSAQRGDPPGNRDNNLTHLCFSPCGKELVAFLLWYIFLVLCCVVPTCCAYRRRRIVEQRMNQQQADLARMQESNFFFLSSLTTRRDGEAVQAERSRVLSDALKDTTMVCLLCSDGAEADMYIIAYLYAPTTDNTFLSILADGQGVRHGDSASLRTAFCCIW